MGNKKCEESEESKTQEKEGKEILNVSVIFLACKRTENSIYI